MNNYGLIGYPLGHSFSKKYFTQKFEKEKRADCFFELFPLQSISLFPALIAREKNLKGLAVTIPYKESVIPFLTAISPEAKEIGAVNCIKINGEKTVGYNTDVIGFERSFTPLLQFNHSKALVLGSGGSSKAVQFVLKKLGIPFLIVSRNAGAGEQCINYQWIDKEIISGYPVIINCTPAGMTPNDHEQPPIPYHFLNNKNLLFDLVYTPAQTRFLASGLHHGAMIKNGYEMLILQAEENWRIWNE